MAFAFSQNTLLFLLNFIPCAVICLFFYNYANIRKKPAWKCVHLSGKSDLRMGQKELPVSLGGLGMAVVIQVFLNDQRKHTLPNKKELIKEKLSHLFTRICKEK